MVVYSGELAKYSQRGNIAKYSYRAFHRGEILSAKQNKKQQKAKQYKGRSEFQAQNNSTELGIPNS